MKILLVYPNLYGMNMLPPAIGLFTAILRRGGHSVALFDTTVYEDLAPIDSDKAKADNLNARPYDNSLLRQAAQHSDPLGDFRRVVSQLSPGLIAMSATEDMYPIGITLLQALGNNRPKVVIGGVFPTFAPDLALQYSNGLIDYVLRGEGDETLLELCNALEAGLDPSNIAGLYQRGDRRTSNPLPRPVELSTLPIPDYSLFDDSRFYRPMQGKLWRMLPVQTVRGCPYTCAYCNSPSQIDIHKAQGDKFFRKQRIDLIKAEIQECIQKYKADSLYFWADTFLTWENREFEDFCDMYSEFKLPFWIQTRPETVRLDRFKRLQEIGVLRVAFGVEHGNETFREKILLRKVRNELITANLKIVTDLDIPISVNNIMGFPTETRRLVSDTIELNRTFRSDGINAYSFVPFHGTPLRALSEKLGLVTKGTLARSIMAPTMLDMPQFGRDAIEGVRRCFVLYEKMPKSRWPEIARAEALTSEGDSIFTQLKSECREKYMNYGDYVVEDDVERINFDTAAVSDPAKQLQRGEVEQLIAAHSSRLNPEENTSGLPTSSREIKLSVSG